MKIIKHLLGRLIIVLSYSLVFNTVARYFGKSIARNFHVKTVCGDHLLGESTFLMTIDISLPCLLTVGTSCVLDLGRVLIPTYSKVIQ